VRHFLRLSFVAATLALSGCATAYVLVPAQATKVAKASMTITPGTAWNKSPYSVGLSGTGVLNSKSETWTQDGPSLNQVTFFGGIKDGESLIKMPGGSDRKAPLFKSSMLPQEVVEFVEKSFRVQTTSPVFAVTEVKPLTFAGQPGFQFDFAFTTPDEVRRKGRAAGAVKDGQLYLIVYEAAAIHYFDRNMAEFEKLLSSATLG
jgi:hypothetical protein